MKSEDFNKAFPIKLVWVWRLTTTLRMAIEVIHQRNLKNLIAFLIGRRSFYRSPRLGKLICPESRSTTSFTDRINYFYFSFGATKTVVMTLKIFLLKTLLLKMWLFGEGRVFRKEVGKSAREKWSLSRNLLNMIQLRISEAPLRIWTQRQVHLLHRMKLQVSACFLHLPYSTRYNCIIGNKVLLW